MLLLILAQFGYYGLQRWQQHEVREAFEARLKAGQVSDSLLDIIETDAAFSGLQWEKRGKECWYQGALYDVVRIEKQGSRIFLFALRDGKEKKMLEAYARAAEKSPGSRQQARNLLSLFETDFPDISLCLQHPPTQEAGIPAAYFKASLLFSLREVQTPPPRS